MLSADGLIWHQQACRWPQRPPLKSPTTWGLSEVYASAAAGQHAAEVIATGCKVLLTSPRGNGVRRGGSVIETSADHTEHGLHSAAMTRTDHDVRHTDHGTVDDVCRSDRDHTTDYMNQIIMHQLHKRWHETATASQKVPNVYFAPPPYKGAKYCDQPDRLKWRHSNLWSRYDLHVVRHNVALCKVN